MSTLNDFYNNLLSISRGDVGTFRRVADDFAKTVENPVHTDRKTEPQTHETKDRASQ